MVNFTFQHRKDSLEAFFTEALRVCVLLLFSIFIPTTSQAQVRQIQINPSVNTASLPSSGAEVSEEILRVGISGNSIESVDELRPSSPRLWNADMGGVNLFRLPEPWIHDAAPFPHDALIGPVWNLGMSGLSNQAVDQENGARQFLSLPGATNRAQDAVTILEGNEKVYNVSLDTQPSSEVTVTITVDQGTKLTVNPTTLTFPVGAWDTAQPVTLTAEEDSDNTTDTVNLTLANSGGDTSSKQVAVTIVDDEIIWELTPLSMQEGDALRFPIQLLNRLGQPSGDVTFKITGYDENTVIPKPTPLKFRARNWPKPKRLSLVALQDQDSDDELETLIFTATGGGYDGLQYSLDVRIQDVPPNEEIVPEGESIIIKEYYYRRASPPEPGVTYIAQWDIPDDADLTMKPSVANFTPGSWFRCPHRGILKYCSPTGPIEIAAAHDADKEDDQEYLILLITQPSLGASVSVNVRVSDDDDPGLVVNPSSIEITEGGDSKTFTVKLSEPPLGDFGSNDVTVRVPSPRDLTAKPSRLTFTSENWNTERTVTLTAGHDSDLDDDFEKLWLTASGGGYDLERARVSVKIIDDDDIVVFFDSDKSSTKEGEGTKIVIITVSPAHYVPSTFRRIGGTATLGADYTISDRTRRRVGNSFKFSIPVNIVDDSVQEQPETLILTLNPGYGFVVGTPSEHTLTIEDNDDPVVSFDVRENSAPEDKGTYDVVVNLSPAPASAISINYSPTGTATQGADADYTVSGTTIQVDANTASMKFPVTIIDDQVQESDETVILTLDSGTGYTVGTSNEHTLTIKDNDAPVVSFDVRKSNAPEDKGTHEVVVNLSPAPASAISINYSPTGTATQGADADYTVSGTTIPVDANAASVKIPVTINDDEIDELAETVILTLDSGTGYTVGTQNEHTLTIKDNDAPVVSFDVRKSNAPEDKGTHEVVVNLSPAPASAISINYSPTGTATQGADADYTVSGTTIPVDANAASVKIPVTINDDEIDELAETVILTLDSGTGYTVGTQNEHTLTIEDNDDPVVSFDRDKISVGEDAGTYNVVVNLSPAPASEISINYSPTGTATQGADADYTVSGTTIRVDANIPSVKIPVTIIDDKAPESDETVILTLDSGTGYTVGTPNPHTLTISDNDVAGAGLVVSPPSVKMNEGSSQDFTVALSAAPKGSVTVTVPAFTNPDLTRDQSTLTFTTVNYSQPQTVTVSAAEDADTANEFESITLTAKGGGYDGVKKDVRVSVEDNDVGGASLVVNPPTVQMNEGSSQDFTVALSAAPKGSVTVTVPAFTNPDLTRDESTLMFTIANYSEPQTVTVSAAKDADTDNESESITLTAKGGGYDGVKKDVRVSVEDNDVGGASLVVNPPTVQMNEGSSQDFTVALSAAPKGSVTVTVPTFTNPDLTRDQSTLTFTTANYRIAQTVTVSAAEDADTANESESITLTAKGGGYDGVKKDVRVSVEDNDVGGASLVVNPPTVQMNEGSSQDFTVALSAAPKGSVTVTVPAFTNPDLSRDQPTLRFTTANYRIAQTVTVTAAEDADTANESEFITLTAKGGGYDGVKKDVRVSVEDNDVGGAGLVVNPPTVQMNEGSSQDFTVALSAAPKGEVTVTVPAFTNPDLTRDQSTLTFTTANYRTAQMVTVSAAKDTDTDNESESIRLTARGGGYDGVSATVRVTVLDGGRPPIPTVRLVAARSTVNEGESVDVTVEASTSFLKDVQIPLDCDDRTTEPDDYRCPAIVTIPAGEFSGVGSIFIEEDDLAEPDEEFVVSLGRLPSGMVEGSPSVQPITIIDNDDPPPVEITLEVHPNPVNEGNSTQVRAVLSGGVLAKDVTIPLACSPLTAEGGDYQCPSQVRISAGAPSGEVKLETLVDEDTDNEQFSVAFDAVPPEVEPGSPLSVVVTILDTTPAMVTLSVSPAEVEEGRSAPLTVALSAAQSEKVRIPIVCIPMDAEPHEYRCPSHVEVSSGQRSGSASISVEEDDIAESNEVFTVALGTGMPPGTVAGTPSVQRVTILDNDAVGIELVPTSLNMVEGVPADYTVRLSSEPVASVMVQITELGGRLTWTPPELVFTSSDWNTPQSVTVEAEEDENTASETTTLTHLSTSVDPGYSGRMTNLPVSVADSGTPNLVVSPSELSIPEGGSGVFTVLLVTEPSTPVTVQVPLFENPDLTRSQETLRFTSLNWHEAQTVTVRSAEDADAEAEVPESLQLTATGGEYTGITGTVLVTVVEKDQKGIELRPSSLTLAEGGPAGTYTVQLRSAPTSAARITITGHPEEKVTLTPESLTITASNWNVPQTITVQAEDDADLDDAAFTLLHTAVGGGYDDQRAGLPVRVEDKGEDALTISIYDARVSEPAEVVSLRVELNRASDEVVTVQYQAVDETAESGSDYTASRGIVIFDAGATRGVIEIEITDDELPESTETLSVTLSKPRGATIARGTGRVTILDNDSRARIWVDDAVGFEDAGMVRFTVHLSQPDTESITVHYQTENGTAVAGEDYHAAKGTLTFAPGVVEEEIEVRLLDDGLDAEEEMFSVHLESFGKTHIEKGVAVATIQKTMSVNRAVLKAYMARFVRTSTIQIVDALQERLRSSTAGSSCSAGQRAALAQVWGTATDWDPSLGELLAGCRVSQEMHTGGGVFGVWGNGAFTRFNGRAEAALHVRGEVTTAMVGTDYRWNGGWRVGVLVSHSQGDGSFTANTDAGDVASGLTGLVPYVSIQGEDWGAWVAAGYGWGRAEVPELEGDLVSRFGAMGVQGALASRGVLGLNYHGDVLVTGAEVEEYDMTAEVYRVRAGVEANARMSDGVRPYVEVNVRQDGGSAETGTGLELGGGVRVSYPGWRLKGEVRTQGLVMHTADGFTEWGMSGMVQVGGGSEGLMVAVRPSWGPRHGGVLHQQHLETTRTRANLHRTELELAYGIPFNAGVMRPVMGMTQLATGRMYRVGAELRPWDQASISLSGLAQSHANSQTQIGVNVQGSIRY